MMRLGVGLPAAALAGAIAGSAQEWKPVEGQIMTKWAKAVKPSAVLSEHPRPHMVRPSWTSLNGLWEYAIRPRDEGRPGQFEGRILVPFPVESALSGVGRTPGPEHALWYRKQFLMAAKPGRRRLLHFGAADWEATVWLNGQAIGIHRGGYTPFTFDITDHLAPGGTQELVVKVWDPCDQGIQPCGKQALKPGGVRYTGSSGIWGTVWTEEVPAAYIRGLRFESDLAAGGVRITVDAPDTPSVKVAVYHGQKTAGVATGKSGEPFFLKIGPLQPWSPEDPFLYGVRVGAGEDMVTGYLGLRTVEVRTAEDGHRRIFLNGKPLFLFGPFLQGFWPDGLYTAPTDEALRSDLETVRKMGFNLVLQCVKIEPTRWYYWCDRLGLAVWQEMPDSRKTKDEPEAQTTFRKEMQEVVDALRGHPSILIWSPFHLDWGQFDPEGVTAWLRGYDPGRLISNLSGESPAGIGDIRGGVAKDPEAAAADGPACYHRFGIRGVYVPGHTWSTATRTDKTPTNLADTLSGYADEIGKLRIQQTRGAGIASFVHFCDAEHETIGLVTYDREVCKAPVETLARLNGPLFQPASAEMVLAGCAYDGQQPQWRYVTATPPDGWKSPDFDASKWTEAPGAIGKPDAKTSKYIATVLDVRDLWIRREFVIDGEFSAGLYLRVIHDDDAQVYLNGEQVFAAKGTSGGEYKLVPLPPAGKLKNGKNLLAAHCYNAQGGHIIDMGIVEIK